MYPTTSAISRISMLRSVTSRDCACSSLSRLTKSGKLVPASSAISLLRYAGLRESFSASAFKDSPGS
ncbi:hypothetical protein D3C75_1231060 [compost metagenome]